MPDVILSRKTVEALSALARHWYFEEQPWKTCNTGPLWEALRADLARAEASEEDKAAEAECPWYFISSDPSLPPSCKLASDVAAVPCQLLRTTEFIETRQECWLRTLAAERDEWRGYYNACNKLRKVAGGRADHLSALRDEANERRREAERERDEWKLRAEKAESGKYREEIQAQATDLSRLSSALEAAEAALAELRARQLAWTRAWGSGGDESTIRALEACADFCDEGGHEGGHWKSGWAQMLRRIANAVKADAIEQAAVGEGVWVTRKQLADAVAHINPSERDMIYGPLEVKDWLEPPTEAPDAPVTSDVAQSTTKTPATPQDASAGEEERSCATCLYCSVSVNDVPCDTCRAEEGWPAWESTPRRPR